MKQEAFGVWDTEAGQWWAMYAYGTLSAAKNSWNSGRRWLGPGKGYEPRFNDQTRYIVRPIRFTPLDIE